MKQKLVNEYPFAYENRNNQWHTSHRFGINNATELFIIPWKWVYDSLDDSTRTVINK